MPRGAVGRASARTQTDALLKYAAFMSYSHAADAQFAPLLQAAIQRFARPWYRLRSMRIFRDRTGLSITQELWPEIEAALDSSESFILLASPEGARSDWVQREISHWLTLGRTPPLIVWTAGKVSWDKAKGDFDWTETTAVPKSLAGVYREQPFFLDVSEWAKAEQMDPRNPRLREAAASIFARLAHKDLDDVIGDDIRQYRRTKIAVGAVGGALGIATIAAATSYKVAESERGVTFADHLLAQSELAATQQRNQLEISSLLAADAVRRLDESGVTSVDADRVLRADLALLPAPPIEAELAAQPRAILVNRPRREIVIAAYEKLCAQSLVDQVWRCIPHNNDGNTVALKFAPSVGSYVAYDEKGLCLFSVSASGDPSVPRCRQDLGVLQSVELRSDGRMVLALDNRFCLADLDVDHHLAIHSCVKLPPGAGQSVIAPGGVFAAFVLGEEICLISPNGRAERSPTAECSTSVPGSAILAISATGKWVVSKTDEQTAIKWNVDSRAMEWRFSADAPIAGAAVSASEQALAIITGNPANLGKVSVLDPLSGRMLSSVGHLGRTAFAEFSESGRYLLTGSGGYYPYDGTASIWDPTSGHELARVVHRTGVSGVAAGTFMDDETVVTVGSGGDVKIWKPDTKAVGIYRDLGEIISNSAISSNGDVALVGRTKLCIYRADSAASSPGDCAPISVWPASMTFRSDGTLVFIENNKVCQWRDRLQCIETEQNLLPVSLSQDGATLAAVGPDEVCAYRLLAPPTPIRCVPVNGVQGSRAVADGGNPISVMFTPIDTVLVGLDSGRRQQIPPTIGDREAESFSADGRYFAYSDVDGRYSQADVTVWSVREGKALVRLRHYSRVHGTKFSADGKYLAVASGRGRGDVQIWDWRSRTEVARLAHDLDVRNITFSEDGLRLLSLSYGPAGSAATVRQWVISVKDLLHEACNRLGRSISADEWTALGESGEPPSTCRPGGR